MAAMMALVWPAAGMCAGLYSDVRVRVPVALTDRIQQEREAVLKAAADAEQAQVCV